MLYPSIYELTKNHESRYALVIAVSKRARQIAGEKRRPDDEEAQSEKPVKEAINEIADGRIRIVEVLPPAHGAFEAGQP
ncbi:MAG: DNA-directed RNA polymerase subunit omega [Clostridiales bacterium]|mgnify:FL=1|nr:DNA-directed RNA polymerase subunit omega [Clostridiales bacterium]